MGKLFDCTMKILFMQSKAHLKTHPLHPMLIGFPISFFMGALLFDFLFLLNGNEALRTTGYHLVIAGIIGAVMAAIPGFIDYLHTVPPKSSAKKRAATHGLLNTTNLVLFIVVFFLKINDSAPYGVIVGIEAAGVALMTIAGWMGGTLVYRNQIGVVPRYADAGNWKEEHVADEQRVKVALIDELKLNQMKLVHVGQERIVIARSEEGYVAFSDHCTHRGGSLAGGVMICGTVHCPWHGSHFSVHDGSVKAGPATERIKTYLIEEKDGAVYLYPNKTK